MPEETHYIKRVDAMGNSYFVIAKPKRIKKIAIVKKKRKVRKSSSRTLASNFGFKFQPKFSHPNF